MGIGISSEKLEMVWILAATQLPHTVYRPINKIAANSNRREAFVEFQKISDGYGPAACVWMLVFGIPCWYFEEAEVPRWVCTKEKRAQFLKLAMQCCVLIRRVAVCLGLSPLVEPQFLYARRKWSQTVCALVELPEDELDAAKIQPTNANYYIIVRGRRDEKAAKKSDFVVDIFHLPTNRWYKNFDLSRKELSRGTRLNDWASKIVGRACSSNDFDSKSGFVVKATTIMDRIDRCIPVPERAAVYGRQKLASGRSVYVLSKDVMLDMDTGDLISDAFLPEFNERLLNLEFRPTHVDKQTSPSLKEWVSRWNAHYKGLHVAELVVTIAHCAMCMKMTCEKSILVLGGRSDNGKTTLLKFVAEIFGFEKSEITILGSVNNVGLWERLEPLSGMPIFCNDARANRETLNVVKENAVACYDGTGSAIHNKTKLANGFLVLSLNDKSDSKDGADGALEQLMQMESDRNRYLLCPVRKIPEGMTVTSIERMVDPLPSSTGAIREMLMISQPRKTDLPSSKVPGRIGRQLQLLWYYVEKVAAAAQLTDEIREEVKLFCEVDMVRMARDLQLQDELLVDEFCKAVVNRFFENGKLVEWERRKSLCGRDKNDKYECAIIQKNTETTFHVRISELFKEVVEHTAISSTWKSAVEDVLRLKNILCELLEEKPVRGEANNGQSTDGAVMKHILNLARFLEPVGEQ